jgi:conjugative relaxase-like TrwC/TraI family protein
MGGTVVLSVGRVGAGGARYYASQVAASPLAYYSGAGEAPGVWVGDGAADVGLSGRVDEATLGGFLAGNAPDGTVLAGGAKSRLGGLDLTFSAPKSVSMLWGLHPDPSVRETVAAAHRAAVTDAVGYVETEALTARRGRNGTIHVAVRGLVGAAFTHRSSRAGDPQLHTHVVVCNMVADNTGRWSTFDSRTLYRHAAADGYVYQASLRHHLAVTLGVEWGPVCSGQADLEGVERETLEVFSARRAEITAALAERGARSARAARVATLDTRPAKHPEPPDNLPGAGGLFERWARQAAQAGVDVTGLIRHHPTLRPPEGPHSRAGTPEPPGMPDGHGTPEGLNVDGLLAVLAGPAGLTADTSSFARRDVIKAVAAAARRGATAAQITRIADRFTAGRDAVELTDSTAHIAFKRWTTLDMIATENALLAVAANHHPNNPQPPSPDIPAGQGIPAGVASRGAIQEALACRPTLDAEQAGMVAGVCSTPAGVVCVVGKAGTGKTFALDAARDAWARAGLDVVGAALSARAALELQAGSAIPSFTLARLLADLAVPETRPAPGSVIVVDEAGMVGTRQLLALALAARDNNWKLVLVGDPRQLPEIQAGGAFAALCETTPTWRLETNRRQRHAWERAALDLLRDRRPAAAVAAYHNHSRIVASPTAPAQLEALVAGWFQHRNAGQRTLIVAPRRHQVDDINQAIQTVRARAGQIDPAQHLDVPGGQIMAGDEIVCLRNDRRRGVHNGLTLTVTGVDADLTLQAVDRVGAAYSIDAGYSQAGHVTLAYATTIHKAQGVTVDVALLVGDENLYAQSGYVALSRGRQTNLIYTINPQPDQPGERTVNHEQLLQALSQTKNQQLATNQIQPDTANTDQTPAGSPTQRRETLRDEMTLAGLLDERQHLRNVLAAHTTNPATPHGTTDGYGRSGQLDLFNNNPTHQPAQPARPTQPEQPGGWDATSGGWGDDSPAWDETHRRIVERIVETEKLIAWRVETLQAATSRGPAHPALPAAGWVADLLGPPPAHPAGRQRWDQAVTAANIYHDASLCVNLD